MKLPPGRWLLRNRRFEVRQSHAVVCFAVIYPPQCVLHRGISRVLALPPAAPASPPHPDLPSPESKPGCSTQTGSMHPHRVPPDTGWQRRVRTRFRIRGLCRISLHSRSRSYSQSKGRKSRCADFHITEDPQRLYPPGRWVVLVKQPRPPENRRIPLARPPTLLESTQKYNKSSDLRNFGCFRLHGRYCDMNVPQFANGVLGKLGIYSLTSQILPSVLVTAVE